MQIRPYQDGDEQGFLVLDKLLEIHPWNQRNLANWQWKYKGKNPAGDSLIFIADNKGEMVSYFAAIPMCYWINGEKIRGSHSIAMMVKPEWQNKGLIKFVADKLIKELENQKIPFTYGYPNDNAYDLHKTHLGYSDISMQFLIERTLDESSDIDLHNFSSSMSFRKIDAFDISIDTLWDEVKNDFRTIVIRNADFLNWRYIARPDVPYFVFGAYDRDRLVGYCILKLYRENKILRGHFMDLFTVPGENNYGRFLVQNGLAFLKNEKVSEINLWMQGSPFFRAILGEYGFEENASRPMICRFNLEQEKFRPLLTEKDWYFTMGDTLEIY